MVTGTLNAQKYQDEILESGVRSALDSLDGQNMVLGDDIAKPHCIRIIEEYKNQQNIASLPWLSFCGTCTLSNTCWTSSSDVFEIGNQPYQNHCDFVRLYCMSWTGFHVLYACTHSVNLIKKMCQVVIRQCEDYTQHEPEVVDYYEPFRDFLHQILKYFEEITTIGALL